MNVRILTRPKDVEAARKRDEARRLAEATAPTIEAPRNSEPATRRILIGTPTLGLVRVEWHNAMTGIVVPCNWSNSVNTPIGFLVHDAQNILVQKAIDAKFDWLALIEDDVLVPPDIFLKWGTHMERGDVPIISGLYHLRGPRSSGPEPLMYRGRGTGAFKDWKPSEQVWVDGVPTGCLLIHTSILRALWEQAEPYTVQNNGAPLAVRRVFNTPREAAYDSGTGAYQKFLGTSDLFFCDEVIRLGILKKAGWPDVARRKYPFLVDTSIRCGHIERDSGAVY